MSINFDLATGKTLELFTAGKYCDRNIVVKATGGGQAHNNMPPYLAVYVWKRTA